MTSINALRLNWNSGLLVCDEARFWNPEWSIIQTPDKIRAITDNQIMEEADVIAFIGSTGASAVGDEIMESVRRRIREHFAKNREKGEPPPETNRTISEIARYAYKIVTELFQKHLNDFIVGKFGFTSYNLMQGKKEIEKEIFTIENDEIVKEAAKYINLENAPAELSGLYNNAQILAGFDPQNGFQIFFIEERNPVLEEVADIYLSEGSGKISSDLTLSSFAASKSTMDRRNNLDRVEALMAMLEGNEEAHLLVAGITGYPKIIYIDGTNPDKTKRLKQISDRHSKLAAEITSAAAMELISQEKAYSLIDRIIFQDAPFNEINDELFKDASPKLSLFLRGYRIEMSDNTYKNGGQ